MGERILIAGESGFGLVLLSLAPPLRCQRLELRLSLKTLKLSRIERRAFVEAPASARRNSANIRFLSASWRKPGPSESPRRLRSRRPHSPGRRPRWPQPRAPRQTSRRGNGVARRPETSRVCLAKPPSQVRRSRAPARCGSCSRPRRCIRISLPPPGPPARQLHPGPRDRKRRLSATAARPRAGRQIKRITLLAIGSANNFGKDGTRGERGSNLRIGRGSSDRRWSGIFDAIP